MNITKQSTFFRTPLNAKVGKTRSIKTQVKVSNTTQEKSDFKF
ncbi:hypothetical protein [Psychroserpens sp. Hel_I_66]|nr:hypothetical protein [Psychroserpens sp. Hel_I_66]